MILTAAAACGLLLSTAARAQSADDMPRPPLNAAPGRVLPVRDATGHYQTPNRDLSPIATAWHVRAALNVAALMCRDQDAALTVAAYNAMLVQDRDALAADNLALIGEYRAHYGADWQAKYDSEMTQLYGFFAEPGAYRAFCTTARETLAAAMSVPSDGFNAFAATVLDKLEAPITHFYGDYDHYLTALAAWRSAHVPATVTPPVLASASPAPVSVAAPVPASVSVFAPTTGAPIAPAVPEAAPAASVETAAPAPVPAAAVAAAPAEIAPVAPVQPAAGPAPATTVEATPAS